MSSTLLSSRLVGLNDVAATSLVNVNVATCGKHVKFMLLMPCQQDVHVPPAQVEARDLQLEDVEAEAMGRQVLAVQKEGVPAYADRVLTPIFPIHYPRCKFRWIWSLPMR